MSKDANPLDRLLNRSVENAPASHEEARKRLAARPGRQEPEEAPQPSAAPEDVPEPDHSEWRDELDPAPSSDSDGSTSSIAYGAVDYAETESASPSLEEVAAQLSERTAQFEELEARLASEEISVAALDGQLRVVITGDGRPISLDIDRAAVKGPERRRLGAHIAELIMTARQQADVRRDELEQDPLFSPGKPGGSLGEVR